MEDYEPGHEDSGGELAKDETAKESSDETAKETKIALINIEGMTCHSCEAIIKKTAMRIDGVIGASADYAEGTGTIEYDPDKIKIKM